MVLDVCRQVLRRTPDAEDAFQATFLVMVQRASTIRKPDSLGSWLYGIALRVARQSRKQAEANRSAMARLEERSEAAERSDPVEATESRSTELLEAVEGLPDPFRSAIVLHYFQGLTTEAIAARTGCRRGTILSRLARARERLKTRLENRLGSRILIPGLEGLRRRALPRDLAANAVRACKSLGLAESLNGDLASVRAATLAAATLNGLSRIRHQVLGAFLLAAAVPAAMGGLWLLATPASQVAAPSGPDQSKKVVAEVNLTGQVVDPSGKPVAGARVSLSEKSRRQPTGPDGQVRATTDAEGRFQCPASREELAGGRAAPWGKAPGVRLTTQAQGFGPAWIPLDTTAADHDLKITLCPDDVPIVGRLLDQEGQPVAGASVVAEEIYALANPADFARDLRKTSGRATRDILEKLTDFFRPIPEALIARAKTDPDGRFTLRGVGRDRVASVRFEGSTIETDYRLVFTKAGPIYRPEPGRQIEPALLVLGPRFELKVSPGRVIEGAVLDLESGTPIAGARVFSGTVGWITADAKGRYRLSGQPMRGVHVFVETPDEPYLKAGRTVMGAIPGGPLRTDFRLKRGVWLRGKVVDRQTGQPLSAFVEYLPRIDNPAAQKPADETWRNELSGDGPSFRTDEQGRFRAVVLPGPGMLAVMGQTRGYSRARLGPDEVETLVNPVASGWLSVRATAFQEINPAADTEAPEITIALNPGKKRFIRLVDGAGQPVEGAEGLGVVGGGYAIEHLATAEIPYIRSEQDRARTLLFIHRGRALGGFQDVTAETPERMDLALRPTGTIVGRLVDEKGSPLAGFPMALEYGRRNEDWGESWLKYSLAEGLTTDGDGRFRIPYLVPGITYRFLSFGKKAADFRDAKGKPRHEWTVAPGETQDWGEARIRE